MDIDTNGALTIRFTGWERVLGLRTTVTIPRDQIREVTWHPEWQDPGGAWRSGGTGAPGILYGGRFRRHGKREVWWLRHPHGWRNPTASDVLEVVSDAPDATRVLLTLEPDDGRAIVAWFERPGADEV